MPNLETSEKMLLGCAFLALTDSIGSIVTALHRQTGAYPEIKVAIPGFLIQSSAFVFS